MNRFTQLSAGSFKPLSLQEIMMVPVSRQEQHDKARVAAEEYAALQAQSLSQDRDAVTANLNKLRGKADSISKDLLERGVSRDIMNNLTMLKREKEKEFSSEGLIGNAQSNFSSASEYMKALAEKKERQAGWSPSEARKWAQAQVSNFKGTDAGDGKFNSFVGQELEDYVDTTKWINDNVKNVAADTRVLGLSGQSLGNFMTDWQSGNVEYKTKEKIIKALMLQAQGDHKLLASLKQASAFTGEKDPLNMGQFKIMNVNGRKKEVFVPSNSSFSGQLYGIASAAEYEKTDLDHNIKSDDLAIKLHMRGLEKQDAEDLVELTNGNLYQIEPTKVNDLAAVVGLAKDEADAQANQVYQLGKRLREIDGVNPNTVEEFVKLRDQSLQTTTKYHNAYRNLKNLQEKAGVKMNNIQKRRSAEGDVISKGVDAAVEETTFGSKLSIPKLMKLGLSRNEATMISEKLGVGKDPAEVAKAVLMGKKGLIKMNTDKFGRIDINGLMKDGFNDYKKETEIRNKKVREYQALYPASYNYKVLMGDQKSEVGKVNKLLTDNFNSTGGNMGYKDANTGADILEKINEARADYDGKIKFVVNTTTGVSPLSGEAIEVIQGVDEDGVPIPGVIFQATRGEEGVKTQRRLGLGMAKGNRNSNEGRNMIHRADYAKYIYPMGIDSDGFSSGVVPGLETPNGELFYVSKGANTGLNIKRISKKEYNNGRGRIIAIRGSNGSSDGKSIGGTDQAMEYINAYMNR